MLLYVSVDAPVIWCYGFNKLVQLSSVSFLFWYVHLNEVGEWKAKNMLCLCLACSTNATQMGASAWNVVDGIGLCVCVMSHVDLVCCLAVHADCGRSARHSWCSRVLRCKVVLVRLVACACTVSPCFERAAYLREEQAQHHVFCVAAGSVALRTRGRRVERTWNFSWYGRGGRGREQVLVTLQ